MVDNLNVFTLNPQGGLASENRPEIEILLCCARTRMDANTARRIEALLDGDIDWNYLFRTAIKNEVTPLLYWHLKDIKSEIVPQLVLDQLQSYFLNNARRNLMRTGELLKLLDLFDTNKIPAVALRGPVFSSAVMGNIALREFQDLDILVRKQDVLKAKDIILSMGYVFLFKLAPSQEAALLQYECEYHFEHKEADIALEILWEISPKHLPPPINLERLWERLGTVTLSGEEILALSPEDLLLILCIHHSKHCWDRLRLICDIAELIRVHQEIDWIKAINETKRMGSERIFFLGLYLASDLLGTELPEKVAQSLEADPAVKSLAGNVVKQLFRHDNHPLGTLKKSYFHFKLLENFKDKVLYCLYRAIGPTILEFELFKLPRALYFLYYLIKPLRLLGKYGAILLTNKKDFQRSF